MAYKTFDKFRQDFEVVQNAARAYHGDIAQTKPVDATIGWKLYLNASAPTLGFQTFGRHITGAKGKALLDFRKKHPTAPLPDDMIGMNHSEQFFKNFGVVNDDKDGSILLMGGSKWNFTINDVWLLGGVNGKNDFYSASPITEKNIIDKNYIFSITGRELFGLAVFGYKMITTTHGIGFVPGDPARAEAGTLVDYQAEIAKIRKPGDAKSFFKQRGFKLA